MADFTPITTQAEFDAAIAERLSRQEKSIRAQFDGMMPAGDVEKLKAGYEETITGLKKQADEAAGQIADLTAKVGRYETDSVKTRIALECGLPYGMAWRLSGETEEEIRRDAESLRGMMKPAAAPLASPEPSGGAKTRDQFADWFHEQMGH